MPTVVNYVCTASEESYCFDRVSFIACIGERITKNPDAVVNLWVDEAKMSAADASWLDRFNREHCDNRLNIRALATIPRYNQLKEAFSEREGNAHEFYVFVDAVRLFVLNSLLDESELGDLIIYSDLDCEPQAVLPKIEDFQHGFLTSQSPFGFLENQFFCFAAGNADSQDIMKRMLVKLAPQTFAEKGRSFLRDDVLMLMNNTLKEFAVQKGHANWGNVDSFVKGAFNIEPGIHIKRKRMEKSEYRNALGQFWSSTEATKGAHVDAESARPSH